MCIGVPLAADTMLILSIDGHIADHPRGHVILNDTGIQTGCHTDHGVRCDSEVHWYRVGSNCDTPTGTSCGGW